MKLPFNVFNKDETESLSKAEQEKKKVSKVEERYMYARNTKTEVSIKWNRFIKLYKGEQWGKTKTYKSRIVENMCFSLIESQLPLMTDRQIEIIVRAQTDDTVGLAEKLNNVINYIWHKNNMQEKLVKVIRDQLILGTGIMKITWNPDITPALGGDIDTVIVDPFDFFPSPESTSHEDMEWCIHRVRLSLRKIRQLYPEKGKQVVSNQVYNDTDSRDITQSATLHGADMADVLEYWHYDEDGNIRVTTSANGILLEDKEYPYEDQSLGFPFIFFTNHPVNGEFWSIGEMDNLESLQQDLNNTHSIIQDNMIANNNTVWLVDRTSGIEKNQITNEPGTVIFKNPGGSAQRVAPPQIPSYFLEKLAITKRSMEEVSGVHEISKGMTSGSVTAASALRIMTENSQTRIRGKLRNAEHAIKRLGQFYIILIRQFYDVPRIVSLTGKEGFMLFSSEEMRQVQTEINPETGEREPVTDPQTGQVIELLSDFDINITSGSSILLNKSALYEQAFALYQNKGLDIETLLDIAEIGDTEEIMNNMIKHGLLPDPNAPKVDPYELLKGLGLKYSMSTVEPDIIHETLEKARQMVEQTGDPEIMDGMMPEDIAEKRMGESLDGAKGVLDGLSTPPPIDNPFPL